MMASALPAVSLTEVFIVAVNEASALRVLVGCSVATLLSYETVLAMGVAPCVNVKLEAVIVVASIASLKSTFTFALVAAGRPVTGWWRAQ